MNDFQSIRPDICREYLTLVLHDRGEMTRLAARRGTHVPNPLTGLWCESQCGMAGREILHDKHAFGISGQLIDA